MKKDAAESTEMEVARDELPSESVQICSSVVGHIVDTLDHITSKSELPSKSDLPSNSDLPFQTDTESRSDPRSKSDSTPVSPSIESVGSSSTDENMMLCLENNMKPILSLNIYSSEYYNIRDMEPKEYEIHFRSKQHIKVK